MLRPKLFDTLKDYSAKRFSKDAIAGVIVGIVALPLAIAFAIASGVSPDKGLITAVIAGFIISTFGGSRVQIGGPTGAFVIIVYGIIAQYGYNGLLIATVMAGIFLIIFGLTKLGSVIKFIPHPVILGFTLGIAFLIFTSQISDFIGLGLTNLPADFIDKIKIISENILHASPYAVILSLATVFIIFTFHKISKRIPGTLVALLITSAAVYFLKLPVETIGSRFGQIAHSLPTPSLPTVDFKTIQGLLNPAFTIAMLGAIESLLSAVVADGMIGGKHRSNMELVAQGAANIVVPFFGGIPATGAIARTATNVRNGGRTPIAGIVHSVTLLLIMLFFSKYISYVPLAALAGILVTVAYHMSEWRAVASIIKLSRGAAAVTLTTFALTVFVDLSTAIEIGLVLATFMFIRSLSMHTNVSASNITDFVSDDDEQDGKNYQDAQKIQLDLPEGALMYTINGPLFFGAVYKLREALEQISKPPKVLILDLSQVPVIDSTGVKALQEAFKKLQKKGSKFVICAMKPQIENIINRAGIIEYIGKENICKSVFEALERTKLLYENSK